MRARPPRWRYCRRRPAGSRRRTAARAAARANAPSAAPGCRWGRRRESRRSGAPARSDRSAPMPGLAWRRARQRCRRDAARGGANLSCALLLRLDVARRDDADPFVDLAVDVRAELLGRAADRLKSTFLQAATEPVAPDRSR